MIPGDVLYIPQGIYHAATTAVGFDTTTHVTIGLMGDNIRTGTSFKDDFLAQDLSRQQIGIDIDEMFWSDDPVSPMKLLVNFNLAEIIFPLRKCYDLEDNDKIDLIDENYDDDDISEGDTFRRGLQLLSATSDHVSDCRLNPPIWCEPERVAHYDVSCWFDSNGLDEDTLLTGDKDTLRLLWYASFLKPCIEILQAQQLHMIAEERSKNNKNTIIRRLLVDELYRPSVDAESVERIIHGANDITRLIYDNDCDEMALDILMDDIQVKYIRDDDDDDDGQDFSDIMGLKMKWSIGSQPIHWDEPEEPNQDNNYPSCCSRAMDFRLLCHPVLKRVGSLWRASVILSLSEQLLLLDDAAESGIMVRLSSCFCCSCFLVTLYFVLCRHFLAVD